MKKKQFINIIERIVENITAASGVRG